ncbi:hypothetical protein [Marinitoga sp. 38H-ov]|uniref:hypothetical protein n=1 Tax=Marinitoga sp. 38H-ov TaxID=1755814 RepID=UPI0013EC1FE8|nr:hypothetical protein [Marinitoga sp. 38H-ov]
MARLFLIRGYKKYLIYYSFPIFMMILSKKFLEKHILLSLFLFIFLMSVYINTAFLSFTIYLPLYILLFILFYNKSFIHRKIFNIIFISIFILYLLFYISSIRGSESIFDRIFYINYKNFKYLFYKKNDIGITYIRDFKALFTSIKSFAEIETLRMTKYKVENLVMTPTFPGELYYNFKWVGLFFSAFFGMIIGILDNLFYVHDFDNVNSKIINKIIYINFILMFSSIVTQGIGQSYKFMIIPLLLQVSLKNRVYSLKSQ